MNKNFHLRPGTERKLFLPESTVEITLSWCPPGTFMMGSPEEELGHYLNEPLHEEFIPDGFWIGKYPVTQEQYRTLKEDTQFYYHGGKTAPADSISHGMALRYCDMLTKKLRSEIGEELEFSLPSSIQWEYACRAGCASALYHGKEITRKYGRCENIREIAWCYSRDKVNSPQPVGQKLPNSWGIHDMLGNVYEWCSDPYEHISAKSRPCEMGGFVVRGGAFCSYPQSCRSAHYRGFYPLEPQIPAVVGFRVVLQKIQNFHKSDVIFDIKSHLYSGKSNKNIR